MRKQSERIKNKVRREMLRLPYIRRLRGFRFYHEAQTIVGTATIYKCVNPPVSLTSGWAVDIDGQRKTWVETWPEAESYVATLLWEKMRTNWKGAK